MDLYVVKTALSVAEISEMLKGNVSQFIGSFPSSLVSASFRLLILTSLIFAIRGYHTTISKLKSTQN